MPKGPNSYLSGFGFSMAAASVSGSGNIAVCIAGDGNTVNVCSRPYVTLTRPVRRTPLHEMEILYSTLETSPFVGREADLGVLRGWLDEAAAVSVLTFTGAGGSGKTRLALELMNRVEAEWACGFVSRFDAPHGLANAPGPGLEKRPLLAVVDYAAGHAEALRELLGDLARYGTALPKLRLLLLERVADPQLGWYQRLFDYSQTSNTAELFHRVEPEVISGVQEVGRRREILLRTLEASARFHAGKAAPEEAFGEGRLEAEWRDPADADNREAVLVQLRKALKGDPEFAAEVTRWWGMAQLTQTGDGNKVAVVVRNKNAVNIS